MAGPMPRGGAASPAARRPWSGAREERPARPPDPRPARLPEAGRARPGRNRTPGTAAGLPTPEPARGRVEQPLRLARRFLERPSPSGALRGRGSARLPGGRRRPGGRQSGARPGAAGVRGPHRIRGRAVGGWWAYAGRTQQTPPGRSRGPGRMVLPARIELATSALPRMRSTTELRQRIRPDARACGRRGETRAGGASQAAGRAEAGLSPRTGPAGRRRGRASAGAASPAPGQAGKRSRAASPPRSSLSPR